MISVTSGNILISGVPVSSICVQKLRDNIAGLPQDTFFLPGSVRDNFRVYYSRGHRSISATHGDHAAAEQRLTQVMTDSLLAVGLYEKIIAAGGLDCDSIDFMALLSPGERQLFNLARLSITSSPIVVMDEVMSSLDSQTEDRGRAFIKDNFKGKTIIGIIHRLDNLGEKDWDSYLLLESGMIAETGKLGTGGRKEKFIELAAGEHGT